MSHTIGLSPDKKSIEFSIYKFSSEGTEVKGFKDETKVEMTKKDVRTMIKDLRDWERVMVE